jgi:hypothetical protein
MNSIFVLHPKPLVKPLLGYKKGLEENPDCGSILQGYKERVGILKYYPSGLGFKSAWCYAAVAAPHWLMRVEN